MQWIKHRTLPPPFSPLHTKTPLFPINESAPEIRHFSFYLLSFRIFHLLADSETVSSGWFPMKNPDNSQLLRGPLVFPFKSYARQECETFSFSPKLPQKVGGGGFFAGRILTEKTNLQKKIYKIEKYFFLIASQKLPPYFAK